MRYNSADLPRIEIADLPSSGVAVKITLFMYTDVDYFGPM